MRKPRFAAAIHGGELRIGQLRGGASLEQLAYMRRHGHQRGAHLLADGGLRIELRRGVDIDRLNCSVDVQGKKQQECEGETCRVLYTQAPSGP